MKLKDIRFVKGFSQKTVADYIGCSSVVYSRYETGDREPSIGTLVKIADCFDVSLDDIVGRKMSDRPTLSVYDKALLSAAHGADERARQDALNILLSHIKQ